MCRRRRWRSGTKRTTTISNGYFGTQQTIQQRRVTREALLCFGVPYNLRLFNGKSFTTTLLCVACQHFTVDAFDLLLSDNSY